MCVRAFAVAAVRAGRPGEEDFLLLPSVGGAEGGREEEAATGILHGHMYRVPYGNILGSRDLKAYPGPPFEHGQACTLAWPSEGGLAQDHLYAPLALRSDHLPSSCSRRSCSSRKTTSAD